MVVVLTGRLSEVEDEVEDEVKEGVEDEVEVDQPEELSMLVLFRRMEDSFVDRARKLMCRVDFLGKFNQVLDLIITFILIIQT